MSQQFCTCGSDQVIYSKEGGECSAECCKCGQRVTGSTGKEIIKKLSGGKLTAEPKGGDSNR